jgi:hypothetical protein
MAQANEAISAIRTPITGGRAAQLSRPYSPRPPNYLTTAGRHSPPPNSGKTRTINCTAQPSTLPGLLSVAIASAGVPLSRRRLSAGELRLANVRAGSAGIGLAAVGLTGRGA